MTTPVDRLMDLADALVTALGTLAVSLGSEESPAFTAAWRDDPVADLADSTLLTPQVGVSDFGEVQGIVEGVPVREFEILLVVERKIGNGETPATICRAMSALTSEIAQYCRRKKDLAAICFKTERALARQFGDYHEKDLYRAEVSTHWREAGYDGDDED
jgi:hypothetical protein